MMPSLRSKCSRMNEGFSTAGQRKIWHWSPADLCILNWPLPIGAFQDQYRQTMVNKYSCWRFHVGRQTRATHCFVINLTLSRQSGYFPYVLLPACLILRDFLNFFLCKVRKFDSCVCLLRNILTVEVARKKK